LADGRRARGGRDPRDATRECSVGRGGGSAGRPSTSGCLRASGALATTEFLSFALNRQSLTTLPHIMRFPLEKTSKWEMKPGPLCGRLPCRGTSTPMDPSGALTIRPPPTMPRLAWQPVPIVAVCSWPIPRTAPPRKRHRTTQRSSTRSRRSPRRPSWPDAGGLRWRKRQHGASAPRGNRRSCAMARWRQSA